MKRKFNNYFIRQLWVAILLLLPVLKSQAQQPTYIKNIKYTDVIFAVYFAHCDHSQMQYTINGTPISPTVLFASSGFIANRIPFGLLHVGDTFTVTNTCDGSSVSKVVQDDYAYVEIPNGTSYTGNGISPSDTDPPYSRLQTPIQLGKCEVVKNVNAHILDNYYFSMNDPITYGVFKHNGYPIVAGDYSNDHYGQTGVNWHINPDGSVYTDNATTLTSYQGYSGANTQSISYTHNGATINSDLTLNFGGLSIRYIQNGSYSIEKNTYSGLQKNDFTGDFSNSTFEIRYTSAAIEAWVDGVKKDELQRDVQYSVSGGGTLSNTGGLSYGTPVDFTPTTSGDYVITAVINGVRRAEQKIHIASDPTVNSVTNANCPSDKGQVVANSSGAGFYPLQYAITGGTWGTTNTFSGLNPGNYTIGVKDASGCEFYNSVTVSVNNSSPSLSVSGTSCAADLKTYSVNFTSNGSVVSSLGTVTGNIISDIPTGTNVSLTATSTAGCQTSLSVTAPNCACPTVNAPVSNGDRNFCVGYTIPAVSANVGINETVDWYDAPTNGNVLASSTTSYQASQAGTYYAETRNTVHGCKSATRTAVTVSQDALPSLSISSTTCSSDLRTYAITFVSDGNVVVRANTGVSSMSINHSTGVGTISGNTVSGIPAGTNVDLTATSTAGCQTSLSVTAPNCACPTVNAPSSAGDKSFCAGSVIPSISVSVGSNETVDWYDAPIGGNVLASSTTSYQGTQAGTYYAETRNTVHGCKSAIRTAVTVSQNALPSLSVSGTNCSADLKTYSVNFTSNGSVISSLGTVAGNIISGIPAGMNVSLTATSSAGCQTSLSVTAPNCACPTVNAPSSAGDKAFCAGSAIPSILVSVGSNETVDWFDAPTGGNVLARSTTSYQATQAGTYYAETINTIHGCKSATRTAVTVSQNALPSLSVSGTSCAADLKTYSVSFTSNGSVVSSSGTVAGNIISGIPAGMNVSLTTTSTAGCQTSLSVTAPNCACPTVNAPSSAGDKSFCAGSVIPSVSVSVGSNETVYWFDIPTGGNVLASSTTLYQATQAGTYYAETKNTVHGCKSAIRTAVTVSQNALPSLSLSGTSCAADLKTYSVNFTSNGSVSSSSGTVSGNSIINIPAGTNVSLTATSVAGCQTSLSVTAPNCACPTVNAPSSAGDKTFCTGSAIPSISVSVGSNETVDWFDAPTGGNVFASSTTSYQPTQAGTYYAETRNTVHGCKSATRTAVTVSQNALPSLSVSGTNCSADLKTYSINFTSNGSLSSSSGTVAGNIISGIPAGMNVSLTATSAAGCQTSLSVTAPNCACPTVNAPSSVGDKSFCAGSAIPSISVSVSSNETVDWYDAPTGGNVLASSTTSYQATQAGTYYAETRNTVHGCKSATRTAVTVSQNTLPSLSVSGTSCAADLKTYSVNVTSDRNLSSTTGLISSGVVLGYIVSSIAAGTNTTLTATSSAGCQTTLDVTAPNCSCPYVAAPVSSGNIISSCVGATIPVISVSVGSDETVDWYDAPTGGKILASATTSYQAIQAGTYYAETRNTVHGCKSATRTAVTLQINNLPSVALVAISCALNIKTYSIDFTTNGSVSTTSGLLSGNAITGVPAGTNVTLTATSPEGCQSSLVVDAPICSPCILRVKADATTITQGQSTTLHATGCAGTFVWQNTGKEGTDITVNPIATTTYTGACWFDAGEPQCTAEITITVNPCQLNATATKETITQGENVTLTASGCENGYLAWVDSKSELATITVKPFVTTTYTAKCWYAEGVESCSVSKTITVNQCQLTATATKQTITQGESVTLTASGCENGYLAWVDSKSELATITVKPFVTTTYTAKCWYAEGVESCSVSKTITVNQCQLTATATRETINQGENTTLTASGCEHGYLAWVDSKSELAATTVKPFVTTTYTAKCWYAEGVESCSISKTITVNSCQLTATATKETINQGENTTLTASGCENGYLAWVDSKSELATITVKPFVTTTYTAKCWYAEGVESCSVSKTITVNQCQLTASATKETINQGENTTLTASGCENGYLAWVDSKSELATITVKPFVTTTYTAKCWYAEGVESCSVSKTITVNQCQLTASATKETINQGENTTLTASGCENGYLAWVDSKSELATITVKPFVTTTYTAKCWYTGGTESCSISKTITVNPCQLSATANADEVVLGESLQIKSTGCVGTLIYPQDTTQNGNSVFTYTPTKSQGFTVQCKVENTISCDTTINIVVAPCHLQARAKKAVLTSGESLTIVSTGCVGTLIYPSDSTQNGNSVFTYVPTKSQDFTVQCKVGNAISCDTTLNIVVAPCHLQALAEKATLTGGELLKITSSGCIGTLSYPQDTTQNGSSVFTYTPTRSQSFTIQCKVGNAISCDTVMNIVVEKCPSIIQATAATIVKGDYTTLSYQGCPNTVVWRGLGVGMSKNVSPSKTTTYYVSCNYGDKLQYSCSTDSIVIKVRPKQPILDNTRLGVSGIALQDTICLNNSLVLGINCDVDAKAYWNDKQLDELKVDASQASIQTYRFYCQNADGKSDESLAEILVKGFEVEDAIIYPVPTSGLLHIKSKGCLDNLRLTLYSLSGQVLYQGNGESRTNDSISIDLTFLPSNEYVLHISGMQGNQPMTKRVRIVKYSK